LYPTTVYLDYKNLTSFILNKELTLRQ
jgi:hypothetical protein